MILPHLQDLLGNGWTVLFTALRVVAVYGILLWLLHLAGKRLLGQMTSFDLLTLLLISNTVQNAMIGPDNSLSGGLLGAVILLGMNRVISRSRLRGALEADPTLLIRQGQILQDNLVREDISQAELMAALREHGLERVEEVSSAVLETDGTISVVALKGQAVRRLKRVKSSRNR